MKIRANAIDVEVEDSHPGAADRPVVLLIMGLGMQLIAWPPAFVQGLVDAGFRVVRFDNRDVGLSSHLDALGMPNLLWQGLKFKFGWRIKPPYSIGDMARDAIGVLDALQIKQAHIVGVSMGGMIAQRVALLAPERVESLASIMSSSGARDLPTARPEVMRVLLSRPKGKGLPAAIDHSVKLFEVIGSHGSTPGFEMEPAELRLRVTEAAERSYYPAGIARQMVAIAADGTRAEELAAITAPTLVIHGEADPLLPIACGEDTARRIKGSTMARVDEMGHDLPSGVVNRLLGLLVPHFNRMTAQ